MRLSELFLMEDAGAGSTGAGGIAGVPTQVMRRRRAKLIKRPLSTQVEQIRYSNSVTESVDDDTNISSIVARLNSAKHRGDIDRPYVTFGLEDQHGNLVRVKVSADQAHEFEQALAQTLQDDTTDGRDIGEIIYDFKDRFDILGVEWPRDQLEEADEEDVEPDDQEDERADDNETDDTDDELPDVELPDDDQSSLEEPTAPVASNQTTSASELNSTLIAIVDMLKAEIEAKKAEAKAREREAEALQARYATEIAQNKVKAEQDILDMEAWNKKNSMEQKEARKLAMLAKYRYEKAQADTEDRELDDYKMVGRFK